MQKPYDPVIKMDMTASTVNPKFWLHTHFDMAFNKKIAFIVV